MFPVYVDNLVLTINDLVYVEAQVITTNCQLSSQHWSNDSRRGKVYYPKQPVYAFINKKLTDLKKMFSSI